ncbi:beta-ketoacyl synthase N-terminal-like domain-containing protein [Actinocrinis sp.]|uniref:beta-ketoacyl synthase N-terminal-like domain-containing protein n=1 Tax=Actinocrinis sp. TaxID=1920516 RepID=UPI002D761278|nr:beta-ketoacyl synthase N-terminal-like domain-containing protein [Actinocrinis sp.]HZP52540.1 beta-ketoacyl synthase N-terminal-like domain-containing protein [Actinocrinis sp.]
MPLHTPSAVMPAEATDPVGDVPPVRILPSQTSATTLADRAQAAGLAVLAASAWPESPADTAPPAVAGFVNSSFSPMAAEVARRCLHRRATITTNAAEAASPCTAVIIASALGDLASARHVAQAVDAGVRIGPLLFFQCVPNAVAGHVAAQLGLVGPVISVGDERSGLDAAGLLIEDADADQVLLIRVEQAAAAHDRDRAEAVLLAAGAATHERSRT